MNALSENRTVQVTIGFILLIVAGAWRASSIVTAFETKVQELQSRITVLESKDLTPVWTSIRNQKGELEQEIVSARQLVEHQIDDLNGDVETLRDRLNNELDHHHHHEK